jgi:hypothetical protein
VPSTASAPSASKPSASEAFEWSAATNVDIAEFTLECTESPIVPQSATTREATNTDTDVGVAELVGQFDSTEDARQWFEMIGVEAISCGDPAVEVSARDDLVSFDADESVALVVSFPSSEFTQVLRASRTADTISLFIITAPDLNAAVETANTLVNT